VPAEAYRNHDAPETKAVKTMAIVNPETLRSRLIYEPQELRFGTSGRRGEVIHLTQLEVYINVLAELGYLQSLPVAEGGIIRGEDFYFAYDLRQSSSTYVPEQQGRGEIAQAVEYAIRDAGMRPVNLGCIPTPALSHYAVSLHRGSVMITGSHIPFDRNGYKTNTARGELRKEDEGPISIAVQSVRERVYSEPFLDSPFDERGFFKSGHRELPAECDKARTAYIERYTSFFHGLSLDGWRLVVYQHSAVGRDVLVEILERLGAKVIPIGRSNTFIPIDTENIDAAQLAAMQVLAGEAIAQHGPIDAVVSTDGDTDRPLILGVDRATGTLRFFGGDLVGMIVAMFLGADAVVVPISCNDAIDRSKLAQVLEPKTRIGSPYVIAGMEQARHNGRKIVCGWEANGGFLLGSDIVWNGRLLQALPTRDAVLPILGVLFASRTKGLSLSELFDCLPSRFSSAALLPHFPRPRGAEIMERLSPRDPHVQDVAFDSATPGGEMEAVRKQLENLFAAEMGFGTITRLNYTDGVRITFSNGEVAHLRPSGNADEFRIYAVADTQARANSITQMGVAEPDGILRRLERSVGL
jgi:phosphomannomutase